MPTNRASYQTDQVSSQPGQTSVRRVDSHHERQHSKDMHDQTQCICLEPQHTQRADPNPNQDCFLYDAVMYPRISAEPVSIENMAEDHQRVQPSQHTHTTDARHSAYHFESPSTYDSAHALDEDALDDYPRSDHSSRHTHPSSSSNETHSPPTNISNHTSSHSLTAANLHLNTILHAAQPTPPLPPSPHLTAAQIRYVNRYGNTQHDESTFATTHFRSAHEVIPIDQRLHFRTRKCDSISFIDGSLLNNDVRPELLKYVERPCRNVAGQLKDIARRVGSGDGVKKFVGWWSRE
jgi:hypothetical protein